MNEITVPETSLNIQNLTTEDYLKPGPYAYIYDITDPFEQSVELRKLLDHAKDIGFTGAAKIWQDYKKSIQGNISNLGIDVAIFNVDQPIDLLSTWVCSEDGAYKHSQNGKEWACTHPLLITRRFYNLDTETEKVELAFKLGKRWRYITEAKSTIASAQKIIGLADYGISVTSDNASAMVAFLQELEALNYDKIDTVTTTSRLGWVNKDEFMPYTEDVEFDGDFSFNRLFRSVHSKGDKDLWLNTIAGMARTHLAVRLAIAASVASPMLKLVNTQPFFVHFWSDMSATGKTLIVMAAASIWGDPSLGEYTQSFNATTVALERTAEVLNNAPLIMDELQLSKDFRGNTSFDVYKLAQGQGKGRGRKTGGVENIPQWCNTIITTGEGTILSDSDGQGAFARVLECEINEVLFDAVEGNRIANIIRNNYGFGGEVIVNAYKGIGEKELNRRFSELVKELNKDGVIQDKQVLLASALLVASKIASEYLFKDEMTELTLDELKPLLSTRHQTSLQVRAYDFLQDWIASNARSFNQESNQVYGVIEDNKAYIIRAIFNQTMLENGFNPRSVLSAFRKAGLIEVSQDGTYTRNDVRKRIGEVNTRCVVVQLEEDDESDNTTSLLPF